MRELHPWLPSDAPPGLQKATSLARIRTRVGAVGRRARVAGQPGRAQLAEEVPDRLGPARVVARRPARVAARLPGVAAGGAAALAGAGVGRLAAAVAARTAGVTRPATGVARDVPGLLHHHIV